MRTRLFRSALVIAGLVLQTAYAPTTSATTSEFREPTISEIYPNAPGSQEKGHEYVEVHNPNDTPLELEGYALRIKDKPGILPLTGEMAPRGYLHFITPFSLANSGAIELIYTYDEDELLIETVTYGKADDDSVAWSNTPEGWRLLPPTPGTANQMPTEEEGGSDEPDIIDVCPTMDGIQSALPDGFTIDESGDCTPVAPEPVAYLPVSLSELLPDPAGSDETDEFIELYNPHDVPIDLRGYVLTSGSASTYRYEVPDIKLAPQQYFALYRSETKLVLANGGSALKLSAPDGVLLDEVTYGAAKTGYSYARVEGEWVSTPLLTPNASNALPQAVLPIAAPDSVAAPALKPCGEGEERNPETNRCRQITASTASLSPCGEGEERNPATNRCRKVGGSASSTAISLVPCQPGQERNPATNRCRATSSASSGLTPCAAGQERNPQTNRCRKIVSPVTSAAATAAAAPVMPEAAKAAAWQWWVVGSLVIGALGYGIFEWRTEISRGVRAALQTIRVAK